MTLTTEQLRARAEALRGEALGWADKGFSFESQRLSETAAALDELADIREAQPVLYASEETLAYAKEGEKSLVTWSESMGDAVIPLYTAPPSPAYPERLPCPVHLLPGLKFGKGVPTRSMLDALVRRAEYESEIDAMTPEQRAENDTRLEKLKALIPQPVPANAVAWEMRYWNDGYNMWHDWERITAEQHAEMSAEHAASNDYEFRALYDAPPAPAVRDGWKLVPAEPTEEMLRAAYRESGVYSAKAYREMLAAAPEGGNG